MGIITNNTHLAPPTKKLFCCCISFIILIPGQYTTAGAMQNDSLAPMEINWEQIEAS